MECPVRAVVPHNEVTLDINPLGVHMYQRSKVSQAVLFALSAGVIGSAAQAQAALAVLAFLDDVARGVTHHAPDEVGRRVRHF